MSIAMEDLIGLNQTNVAEMPIVLDQLTASILCRQAIAGGKKISVMGMNHSQGGHTMLADAHMLITETMNVVKVDKVAKTVTCDAGATWTEIHAAANREQLTPRVQQSSAHFSVGGSISVNCHGRDPRFGPIAETVVSMKVLCGDGRVRFTDRTNEPDLFKAVIGGYGSCGMILEATLKLTDNLMLSPNTHVYDSVAKYQKELQALATIDKVHIHFAWLRCTEEKFFEQVISVNAIEDPGGYALTDKELDDESWGTSEVMRAGWDLSRTEPQFKDLVWKELVATQGSGNNKSRLNWLRSSVSFTASRGDEYGVDILQEYFVPVARLTEMIEKLKTIFTIQHVNVLSSTIRHVRPDTLTNLSYTPNASVMYASIAVDAHVGVQTTVGKREPNAAANKWIIEAINAAIQLGGSYYLPYYKIADVAQFQRAYLAPGRETQTRAINDYNNDKKFWNNFLAKYF
jgi:decaprenylphospho-beta-D-ribofuranose 2-oxidase